MSELLEFLTRLCDSGEAVLRHRPRFEPPDRARVLEFLTQVHGDLVLEIAGPALPIDATTALAAAELTWHACWFLVAHDDSPEYVESRIQMPVGVSLFAAGAPPSERKVSGRCPIEEARDAHAAVAVERRSLERDGRARGFAAIR
jgi:MoxR-vWA-beta-propeller ternary system domain bpX4